MFSFNIDLLGIARFKEIYFSYVGRLFLYKIYTFCWLYLTMWVKHKILRKQNTQFWMLSASRQYIYSNLCVHPDELYAYTSLLYQFTLLRITHIYPFIRIAIRIYIVATLYIRYSLYINLYYPIMLILI